MLNSTLQFFRTLIADQIVADPIWATAGLAGEAIFAARFIVQWLASELKKKSYVPTAFWFMSLIGSLILFAYSIHIKNPIFMLSFSINTLIYLRNLHLIYGKPKIETVTTTQ